MRDHDGVGCISLIAPGWAWERPCSHPLWGTGTGTGTEQVASVHMLDMNMRHAYAHLHLIYFIIIYASHSFMIVSLFAW